MADKDYNTPTSVDRTKAYMKSLHSISDGGYQRLINDQAKETQAAGDRFQTVRKMNPDAGRPRGVK